MKTKTIVTAVLIAALGTTTAVGITMADAGRGGPKVRGDMPFAGGHHAGRAGRAGHGEAGDFGAGFGFIARFDSNGDGSVTQAEIDAMRASKFATFDANGDGTLSLDEFQALWVEEMRARMVDAFQRLDENGDAIVTTQEFSQPARHMVARLDRNGDGMLGAGDIRDFGHHDEAFGGGEDDDGEGDEGGEAFGGGEDDGADGGGVIQGN